MYLHLLYKYSYNKKPVYPKNYVQFETRLNLPHFKFNEKEILLSLV